MFRPVPALIAACVALGLPLAALADKPAHAGKGKPTKIERKQGARLDGRASVRAGKAPVVVVPARDVVLRVQGRNCPPGLAKKDPACIPPGQAKKGYGVGQVVDWDRVHVVSRPGLYGLSAPPAGQRYAIVNGRLVRVERDTGRILSILRVVEAILD